jgi:hypothetical protein
VNLRGSYRALRSNSEAAMLAAIEIYNKPQISYRDECFTILLINSWELLLKAVLSKNKQRIYYPKKRGYPYRTFSILDALEKTRSYFSSAIQFEPIRQNITLLLTYRDNSIHFYNQLGFGVIIFGLAQTSIINYRDLMLDVFNVDMADKITLSLLPLSYGVQPDPIQFLRESKSKPPKNRAVAQFLREISLVTTELESQNLDTSRFLTVFRANLQSVKKISSADVVLRVKGKTDKDPLVIERRVDPNISHPLRRKDVMELIGDELNGIRFTTHVFEAIAWKFDWKNTGHICWQSDVGGLTRYSSEVPSLLKKISKRQIEKYLHDYRSHLRDLRQK